MPKVSVIIPNYNHAPYLNQRIDTVLAQTYTDFELIILDDCSTDNSKDVIEQYRGKDKIKHIVYNEHNSGGPFYQWKKGIDLAAGEYVWMAESDDWCEPTLLETLVQALEHNQQCALAYVQTHTINGGNKIVQTSAHDKLAEHLNGKQYIAQYLAASCMIWNASMLIFRKKFYGNISQNFTTFKLSGDWLFYIEMAKQGDVFISGKVLNYFRKHDKDVSGEMYSTGKNYIEELEILKILKKQALITDKEFKTHLLTRYIAFRVFRYRFTADVNSLIKAAFYNNEGVSYKWFLQKNGRLSLLKIRLNRRLNLLFK